METRNTHHLLIFLRDNVEITDNKIMAGLCKEVRILLENGAINWTEYFLLREHINRNRPKYIRNSGYGWKPGSWTPRLKWLNKHIELTKTL